MFELTVEVRFSAAHRICGHPGPCARLHGHNYRVLVAVAGDALDPQGMLVDFGELKRLCGEVVAPLDHTFLNDLPAFAGVNPTAEMLAKHIHERVAAALAALPAVRVARVTVFESDTARAAYSA